MTGLSATTVIASASCMTSVTSRLVNTSDFDDDAAVVYDESAERDLNLRARLQTG